MDFSQENFQPADNSVPKLPSTNSQNSIFLPQSSLFFDNKGGEVNRGEEI